MVTLLLGVRDLRYSTPHKARAAPKITKSGRLHRGSLKRLARQYQTNLISKETETTGDVAEHLEEHYQLFSLFFVRYQPEIEQAFADSMQDALVNLLAGAPPSNDPYGDAESKVASLFQQFIEREEIAQMGAPGVPTKAALKGVNHRLAHPYAKENPRRPSFVDSGLMLQSFVAWVEGK